MKKTESRLGRWSRLKRNNNTETETQNVPDTAVAEKDKPPVITRVMTLGGTAPIMAPLAGFDEADDDAMTSPPPGAVDLFATHNDEEILENTETEGPLSDEEQALVDALPDLESLDKTSDFTPFMNDKIPAFIRRKALSVLWRSDAVLANLDGLNDYDEDFTVIESIVNAVSDVSGKISDDSRNVIDDQDKDKIASSDSNGNDQSADQSVDVEQDHSAGLDKIAKNQENENLQSEDNLGEGRETATPGRIKR